MPFFSDYKVRRPRWLHRKRPPVSIVESGPGMSSSAASSEVHNGHRLLNRSTSIALHSNIEIPNSIYSASGEENRTSKIPAITSPISNSTQPLAWNTEIQSSVKPSDSIQSPPAITPPIVNDPGPLPPMKLRPAPIAALTSVTSAGNSPMPSSTLDGETVATTIEDIKSSTLWSQAVDRLEGEDRESISGSRDNINLVERFIREIEEKQEECNRKRWFYTNSKGENVFILDGLVTQLNKYAKIGDIALQHHPDVVALAWSGFRFLLQVGTAYTEDMQTASESLEYLLRVLFCCDLYEKLYCKTGLRTVQDLKTSLIGIYTSILKYLCYIKRFLSKNTGERIIASFVSGLKGLLKDVQEKESTVLKHVDRAEKEASVKERTERREETERLKKQLEDIKTPLEEIETAVEKVYKVIESDRKQKILHWLSDIKFMDHHTFSRERRQEKTGQWLEENETYKEWKNSKSSSLLWLRGDAGYGKTILVSYIIDQLQAQTYNENILTYFYCNYKEDNRRRPETVLRTLVKQFCLKDPRVGGPNFVPLPVSSIYVKRELAGHASGELRCQESTDLIINLSKMYHQVTIIVDALDECYHETRRELLKSLKSIVESGSNVKVFLASRFEKDIALMFKGHKCHYIQASDNTKDINNYIDLQLNIRCDRRNCGTEELLLDGEVDDALKEEISRTLKEKANGMFMWANLQILALCEEPTTGCVREALKRLPKDLKETYDRIIERTQIRESSSRIAQSVLGWLLSAQEPCPLPTILQAFAVGPGEDKFDADFLSLTLLQILDYCKNLIVNDTNTQKLRFAHFSVQEYLVGNLKFIKGHVNHTTMAEICLKALLNHHSESESRQELRHLVEYAIRHWAAHVRLSGSPPQSILYKLCKEFLKPSTAYNLWVSAAEEEHGPFKASNTTFVSPFWVACYYRLSDFCDFETSSKEILNEVNNHSWTPLLYATEKGHDEVVEPLLRDSRVDVNLADESGRTPLSRAAGNCVELLLRNSRVDVNLADKLGRTPLSWAAGNSHDEVVELLLRDSRVDVNLADKSVQTPLSWAAKNGHHKVVELLLRDSRVDANLVDKSVQTPLSWAAENGHDKVVELLLQDSRVDVNLADEIDGQTPLSWAAEKGHDKVVELLLQNGRVDVNLVGKEYGRTPLSWAAEKGHNKVVELLLRDSRVDVNLVDKEYGRTPLSWAAEKGHNKVVDLLLRDSRVDVNLVDTRYGQTPLAWAARNRHHMVVKLLSLNASSPPDKINEQKRRGKLARGGR